MSMGKPSVSQFVPPKQSVFERLTKPLRKENFRVLRVTALSMQDMLLDYSQQVAGHPRTALRNSESISLLRRDSLEWLATPPDASPARRSICSRLRALRRRRVSSKDRTGSPPFEVQSEIDEHGFSKLQRVSAREFRHAAPLSIINEEPILLDAEASEKESMRSQSIYSERNLSPSIYPQSIYSEINRSQSFRSRSVRSRSVRSQSMRSLPRVARYTDALHGISEPWQPAYPRPGPLRVVNFTDADCADFSD